MCLVLVLMFVFSGPILLADDDDEKEDLFSEKKPAAAPPKETEEVDETSSETISPPPLTDEDFEDAKPKKKIPGAVSMFGGVDIFAAKKSPTPKPAQESKGMRSVVQHTH